MAEKERRRVMTRQVRSATTSKNVLQLGGADHVIRYGELKHIAYRTVIPPGSKMTIVPESFP